MAAPKGSLQNGISVDGCISQKISVTRPFRTAKKWHKMSDQKKNIIVVDDDREVNQAISRLLNAAGFRAMAFDSAEAFLTANSTATAACMVVDINLEGLSGFELRRRLKQKGVEIPFIFITAYDHPGHRAKANDTGAVAYFTKPFTGENLMAAITKAINLDTEDS